MYAMKQGYADWHVQLLSTVPMQYLIGVILAVVVVCAALLTGFDRDRAFYPTLLIGVAAYYVLFALMGASAQTLGVEIAIAIGFLVFAVFGFKRSLWLVAAAFVAHGGFDLVHPFFIQNPGVPRWWPGFCLTFDLIIAGRLIVSLMKGSASHPRVHLPAALEGANKHYPPLWRSMQSRDNCSGTHQGTTSPQSMTKSTVRCANEWL